MKIHITALSSIFGLMIAAAAPALAEVLPTDVYFIGRDISPLVITGQHVDPDFVGLTNPNYNRITFLYAHWVSMTYPSSNANHYHGLSRYEYYKDTDGNTQISTHQHDGNMVPTSDLMTGALWMTAGSGIYENKLVSYQYPESSDPSGHYSNQTLRGTSYLGNTNMFPVNSAENRLYNGNYGKYTGSLAGANIAFEIVSITDGLHIGSATDTDIFDGNTISVGLGDPSDSAWSFTPVFWVDAGTTETNFSVVLRIKDLNTATTGYLDSGEYGISFTTVPEPASLAVAGMGAFALVARRRKN